MSEKKEPRIYQATHDRAAKVKAIADQIGFDGKGKKEKQFSPLVEALNREKVFTAQGKDWNTKKAKTFWDSKVVVLQEDAKQDTDSESSDGSEKERSLATDDTARQEQQAEYQSGVLHEDAKQDTAPESSDGSEIEDSLVTDDTARQEEVVTQSNAVVLQENVVNELMEMLRWWKEDRMNIAQEIPMVTARPEFDREETATKTLRISNKLMLAAEKKAKAERALTGGSFSSLVEFLLWRYVGSGEEFLRTERDQDTE